MKIPQELQAHFFALAGNKDATVALVRFCAAFVAKEATRLEYPDTAKELEQALLVMFEVEKVV